MYRLRYKAHIHKIGLIACWSCADDSRGYIPVTKNIQRAGVALRLRNMILINPIGTTGTRLVNQNFRVSSGHDLTSDRLWTWQMHTYRGKLEIRI